MSDRFDSVAEMIFHGDDNQGRLSEAFIAAILRKEFVDKASYARLESALDGMMSAYSPAMHTFGTTAWDTAVEAMRKGD